MEQLYEKLEAAKKTNDKTEVAEMQKQITTRENKGDRTPDFTGYLDTYFNSGCCCFDDGDITGIELADGCIRLIKWRYSAKNKSERVVLDESKLADLKLN